MQRPTGPLATNLKRRPRLLTCIGTILALIILLIVFILFGKTFDKVIAVVAFFFVANYALSFISVFVLRRREPLKERPYRAWGYPWTTAAALLGSILFLLGAILSDTRISIYALLLLAVSYPVFRFLQRIHK